MLGCLPQGDHVQIVPAFRVGHVDDATLEPAEKIDPLLAIAETPLLKKKTAGPQAFPPAQPR